MSTRLRWRWRDCYLTVYGSIIQTGRRHTFKLTWFRLDGEVWLARRDHPPSPLWPPRPIILGAHRTNRPQPQDKEKHKPS